MDKRKIMDKREIMEKAWKYSFEKRWNLLLDGYLIIEVSECKICSEVKMCHNCPVLDHEGRGCLNPEHPYSLWRRDKISIEVMYMYLLFCYEYWKTDMKEEK